MPEKSVGRKHGIKKQTAFFAFLSVEKQRCIKAVEVLNIPLNMKIYCTNDNQASNSNLTYWEYLKADCYEYAVGT